MALRAGETDRWDAAIEKGTANRANSANGVTFLEGGRPLPPRAASAAVDEEFLARSHEVSPCRLATAYSWDFVPSCEVIGLPPADERKNREKREKREMRFRRWPASAVRSYLPRSRRGDRGHVSTFNKVIASEAGL